MTFLSSMINAIMMITNVSSLINYFAFYEINASHISLFLVFALIK